MSNNKIYRVVKIIDDMNIVLNCGTIDSININDKFQIYSNKSETIIDPNTNEILGELRLSKAVVEVTTVFNKMCVCQNAKQTGLFSATSELFKKRASLNVEPSQITGDLSGEDNLPIQIGDIAEKI